MGKSYDADWLGEFILPHPSSLRALELFDIHAQCPRSNGVPHQKTRGQRVRTWMLDASAITIVRVQFCSGKGSQRFSWRFECGPLGFQVPRCLHGTAAEGAGFDGQCWPPKYSGNGS